MATKQTCGSVSLLAMQSLPAWILHVDKTTISSFELHPINIATLVTAVIDKSKITRITITVIQHERWQVSIFLPSSSTTSTWFSLSITWKDTFPNHNTAASSENARSWCSWGIWTVLKASYNNKTIFYEITKITYSIRNRERHMKQKELPSVCEIFEHHQCDQWLSSCSGSNTWIHLLL